MPENTPAAARLPVLDEIQLDTVSGGTGGELYFEGEYVISLSSPDSNAVRRSRPHLSNGQTTDN